MIRKKGPIGFRDLVAIEDDKEFYDALQERIALLPRKPHPQAVTWIRQRVDKMQGNIHLEARQLLNTLWRET